nr:DNA/RNA non-specific endonuclease [Rhabdochlamydiaceae bacterium]
MAVSISETFTRIAQGTYLEENKLKHVPRWIKEKLQRHENPNSPFESITIVGKGKYQNATCLHVAYLYWRYLIANDDPNSKYLRDTFDQLLKDPRIDVRAAFTEERLFDRDEGHFSPPDSYGGVYIENGNLAHYALLEEDFETMMKIVSLAGDLLDTTCSTVSCKWFLEEPPMEEIKCVKLFDPDERQWTTTTDLSDRKELLNRIKNTTVNGLLAKIHWTEGTYSNVIRRNNVSLLHIAVRKADLPASTFLASKQKEILDSRNLSASQYAIEITEGKLLRISSEEKKQKVSEIFKILQFVKPLPDPLPKAFYVLHRGGLDFLYFPATKSSIARETLWKEKIELKVVRGRRPTYKEDSSIPVNSRATVEDFKDYGTVYGHLVPDANSRYSEKAHQAAYFLTNFVSQDSVMNNGLWKSLENKVREMAKEHLCLHVYSVGVFKSKEEHGVKR